MGYLMLNFIHFKVFGYNNNYSYFQWNIFFQITHFYLTIIIIVCLQLSGIEYSNLILIIYTQSSLFDNNHLFAQNFMVSH